MSEVERLREQARKLHQSVTNKISRTKRATGAELAGSKFDPRRKPENIERYNQRQLRTAIDEMSSFMRRGNQFVSGSGGAPIPRGQFKLYKKTEAEFNAAGAQHEASLNDLVTPLGFTVKQLNTALPQGHGSAVYGPYKKFDRESTDIESAEALGILRGDLGKKLRPEYLGEKINQGRENLEKVLTILGENDYIDELDKLSEYQFDALWYGTNVAESIFMQYGIEKDRAAGTHKERWQDKVVESAAGELGTVLDWASSLPRERPAT